MQQEFPNGYYSREERDGDQPSAEPSGFGGYALTVEEANELPQGTVFTAFNGQWYIKVNKGDFRFWNITY